MAATIDTANGILRDLKAKIESEDVDGAKSCLTHLKILILDFPTGPTAPAACTTVAVEALEQAALLSLREGDTAAFARNVSQVKPYYARSDGHASSRRTRVLGLHLMHLLTENRLSEFHAELESLSPEEAATDPCLTFPIGLERRLMVGSYDQVLHAVAPDALCQRFVDDLSSSTVRDDLADCLEAAYDTLSKEQARVLLKFDTVRDLDEYVTECRDDWTVTDDDTLRFRPPAAGRTKDDIPSRGLIKQVLSYATELERIV